MKSKAKRLIGILLVLVMMLNIWSVTAMAAVKDLAGNTGAENEAILARLSGMAGGDSDEAYALLKSLGLLDERGNLNVSQSIILDGKSMTLDEVMVMLDDPGTDLSRVADVDGTPVALGDLKTMIQIEKELARIKETYFSGKAFTSGQLAMLGDLMGQIKSDGISARLMGAQDSGLVLTIAPDQGNPTSITYPCYNVTLKYNLSLSGAMPESGVVGFSWKRVRGLLPDGYCQTKLELRTKNYLVFPSEGDVTFGPGAANEMYIVDDVSEFSGVLEIKLNGDLAGTLGCNVSGMLRSFIEFYNADGLTLSDGSTQGDLLTFPITITKPNAFEDGNTWLTSMMGVSNHDRPMTVDVSGYDEKKNPRWDLIELSDNAMVLNYEALEKTAKEIYGSEAAVYKVDAYLGLYDSNVPFGQMKGAMPIGYDGQSPSQGLETIRYYWAYTRAAVQTDLRELDLYSNPLKCKGPYVMYPYISTFPSLASLEQGPIQYVSIVMASPSGSAPYTLDTVWPTDPFYTEDISGWDNTFNFTATGKQRTISSNLSVYDDTPPTLASVDIPAGTYSTGQYVPIILTFSEPVKAPGLSMNINGSVMTASELLMDATGRKAAAMYQVKDVDDTTIQISEVTNLENLTEHKTAVANNGGSGWSFPGVTLESAFMKNAVTAISVSPATVEPDSLSSGATVTLELDQAAGYRAKYAAYDAGGGENKKAPFRIKLTNQSTGTSSMSQAYLSESGGTISAVAKITDLKLAAADTSYLAEVVAYEGSSDTTGILVKGKSASFTVKGIAFVDGVTVIYPTDDKTELSLTDTYRPKLGVSFTGVPTYKTGTWSSSDTNIATIDADGQIALTGTAVGKVSFTFTADDGGLTDPGGDHVKFGVSKEYTVVAGDSPALVIPAEANSIVVRKGDPAEVCWSSNAAFFVADDFEFTIDLFEGNFTGAELAGKMPVYTVTAANTANSATIPDEELTLLGAPAYTVRVSMPHPLIATEKLSAVCYIVVKPAAIVIHLERPTGGLYLLDSETVKIDWSIDNYTAGVTAGDLRVERISTQNGEDVTNTVTEQPVSAQTGSYTLTPAAVSGLKDTYMVTLRAKNSGDEGYSSDSFPIYVYSADALKLEVNGQKVTELAMDNESAISGALPTGTADILALREELALIEYVGINYNDYSWSQLKDGIRWATSDTNTVSVNYRQGGLYEDISKFSMDTYLPETKMALSSVTDGTATITATHANTGMSASVAVDVRTLRGKFYLFQLTPMQKTELSYTDGKGIEKTVNTNADGVLALYEPDGIASDVRLKATGGDGSVWLGTIYRNSLLSGERDATRLQLYPLNTFKLRQAARTEIYIEKPDGSPYAGSLTLRGGVYKNGDYCQTAGILGNTVPDSAHPLKDGKADQTVTVGADGKLTVYMDSTQFWSEERGENSTAGTSLKPTDDLQYILELTGMGGYYPLLVYSNGNLTPNDLVRSAESVVSLESYTGSPRPFISNQTVDYGLSGDRVIDVRHSTGHIGPNETYLEVKLLTTVMLWGQDPSTSGYRLELCDEYSYVPTAQSSQLIKYPFSSAPVVRNTLILSEATITDSGWIAAGKDAGLKTRLSRGGTMLMELPVSPRAVDLTRVPKLTESEDITGMMVDLQSKSGVVKGAEMSNSNKIVNGLMELMGKLSGPVGGSSFKMLITPGEDNAVFNAFIWAGYNSLGLDEVDYDQNGLAFDYKLAESNLSTAPSLNDLTDMARGSYDPGKTYDDAEANQQKGKGNSSTDFGGQLEGYFEAQIQYNFEKGKWEIYVLGGGFTAGFGMSYTYSINAQAGPVPLTATFGVGGALQIDFKAAVRYDETTGLEWATTVTGDSVNDYLTTLRINAYVNAFGGLGFDYSVVALKIGLFGKLAFDNQNKFLSRTYLADGVKRQINGQALQLSGEVGIKFVAQLLFISYELVLASGSLSTTFKFNDWDNIDNYWENTGSGLKMSVLAASAGGSGLAPISSTATLQSREYLERFARSWGTGKRRMSFLSLDSPNALEPLQTNAYPYALPLVSDDGQLLLYAFDNNSPDVADTRIYATRLSGGSYLQGSEIAAPSGFDGYGDSGLSLAGDGSFAAAAWIRQNASLPGKTAGQTLSDAEQALLMNGTEIVAAVYDGTNWTATRLTDNASPDLAPVVATSGGKAIAAWRGVYSGNAQNLLNFSQQDYILYSIYNGSGWSTPKQLYNGTSGAVKGIEAAMLSDGTAAVAYTLDTDSADNSAADYEIGYAIVNAAGEPSFSSIVTQDEWLDENPQIAAVKFASGDERFVLGWHSVRNGLSDIRLAAVDGAGALSNSFIESIARAASGNAVNIDGNFHFVKMSGAMNDIANLSILWPESKKNDAGETDHGILRAVKFIKDGADIRISAALDVAELPERTLLDHFDAYVASGDGKTVKSVIQGSEYKDIYLNDPNTYTVYKDPDGNDVYVANDEVKLFTATATYENRVRLDALTADYANLSLNTLTPIQFTVFNAGMDPIDSMDVKIKADTTTFDNLDLYPNESKTLTCWYSVGGVIGNLDYTLMAHFGGDTDTTTGTVYLDYPDVGISQLRVTSEDKGIRTLRLTLYNGSAATLAGGKDRSVRLGFYDDVLFKNIQSVACGSPGVTVNADKTLSVSGEDALKLIDEGAFTLEASFDIGQYVTDAGLREIPDSGIRLYANAWAEEKSGSDTAVLPEYFSSNNSGSVLFESALARSGRLVSITTEQGLSGDNKTTANILLRNNSLGSRTSGNLIVALLDAGGNVLERQQTYTGDSGSLIGLDGEETESHDFTFDRSGNRVVATYGDLVLASDNAKLSALSFEGLAVRLSDFIIDKDGNYVCATSYTAPNSTLVSFMTEAPGAIVKVNGEVASGSIKVGLPIGSSKIKLEVTSEDGTQKTYYSISFTPRTQPGPTPIGTAPTIATTSLSVGAVGTAYNQTLVAGGDAPITWTVYSGSLPDGLTLSSGGIISGTPTTAGTFNFTIKATNNEGSDTQTLNILINEASTLSRLAGQTRIDTALSIAKATYPDKVTNAVLTRADDYPDALAGSVLAYQLDAPILLVGRPEADQEKVIDYLKSNLKPEGTVYILGGTDVVGSGIEDKIQDSGFNHITRIAGETRYETAAEIVKQLNVKTGTPIVLASGENYPDALAVSSIAAQNQFPILLVQKDGIGDAVNQKIAAIKPSKVYIIGLEGAISEAVESQAAEISGLGAKDIIRIGGADRYATSLAIAEYFNLGSQAVCIATGNDFPDALAGSVYAAKHKAPIILTGRNLSERIADYVKSMKLAKITIFGGEGVVGKDIERTLKELAGDQS
jgi:putative cell wall-binding protein